MATATPDSFWLAYLATAARRYNRDLSTQASAHRLFMEHIARAVETEAIVRVLVGLDR
jgi:hypothetical protein